MSAVLTRHGLKAHPREGIRELAKRHTEYPFSLTAEFTPPRPHWRPWRPGRGNKAGRPIIWGPGAPGPVEVTAVLQTLLKELEQVMALCRMTSLMQAKPDLVHAMCFRRH